MPSPERSARYHRQPRPAAHPEQGGSSQPDILARLEQAIGAIHDSESFRHYLDVQSRFHTYSFGNALLILAQRPDATRVAGYNTWLQLHRQVRRGEKGIRIVVPMRRKANEDDQDDESRLFFGTGTVFDVSQTDGEPLPEVAVPTLEGEAGGPLMDGLLALAEREAVAVTLDRDELPSAAMGAYWPGERRIRFRPAPMRQMVKTLAHEMGHHVHLTRFGEESRVQAERETVAESVAYVVCSKYGIDTGERSFNYIATWAQDGQTLRSAMGTIQKVSAVIIDGIESSQGTVAVVARTA
jgi:N-terminal domain of anti-restriction factor ArdC